jgi:MFS family permease
MFISNAVKVVGCLMMLFGSHPLLAYAVVGLGAAAYSPAKYGILTELLPASQLVKANGWIEGLTITSIILGVLLGGQLVAPHISSVLLGLDVPGVDLGIDLPAEAAIMALVPIYALAAWFNLRIPLTGVEMRPMPSNPALLLPRCPPPRCSGAPRATCATSCWPGAPRRWATAPRRPRPWWAWWPSARRSARCWPPCACGWTWPRASSRWASPWGCW